MRVVSLVIAAALPSLALQAAERIITVGASVTETVYALGEEQRLVGADTSSVFPEAAEMLPRVGYARQLSAEGILSLQPTLVIATEDAGPPAVVAQIEAAGVPVLRVAASQDVESAAHRISEIGDRLGAQEKASQAIAAMQREIDAARERISSSASQPKVLFIYARAGGTLNVSGRETAAAAMIALAGGHNAIDAFAGYKPLTAEAVVSAAPDVILLTSRGLEEIGGVDGMLKQPGIGLSPAGKARRIVAMDDLLLLSFGPRLGQAVRELSGHIHDTTPELSASTQ